MRRTLHFFDLAELVLRSRLAQTSGPSRSMSDHGVRLVVAVSGNARFAGERRGEIAEGVGVYEDASGKYAGEYAENRREGFGVYEFAAGGHVGTYTGEYRGGHEEGDGILEFANGDKYAGEFAAKMAEGLGVYEYASGAKFFGGFKRNLYHGLGVLEGPSGERTFGAWQDKRRLSKHPFDAQNAQHMEVLRLATAAKARAPHTRTAAAPGSAADANALVGTG